MASFKRFIPLLILLGILTSLIQIGCDELVTEQIFITEAGHPIADFELDSLSTDVGCAPHTVSFLDKSDGPRNRWLWTFGDGDSSKDTNPVHTYDSSGLFTVILKIWDDSLDGVDQETKPRYIFIDTATADFTIDNDSACAGSEYTFTPTFFGPTRTFSWDFGDSSTVSTDSIATHTYDSAGIYEVALTVTGNCGNVTKYDTIIASPCPTVIITAGETIGCAPFTVDFVDSSTAYDDTYIMIPSNYTWDFGDGTAPESGSTPSHEYANPGVYTVTLTAVSDGGQQTDSIVDFITVYDSVAADFISIGDTVTCYNPAARLQVKFTSNSMGNLDSLKWYFNEGLDTIKTSEDTPVIYLFDTAGRYDVSLIAFGACSETDIDTIEVTDYINIYNEILQEDLSPQFVFEKMDHHPDTIDTAADTINYSFYRLESSTPGIIDSTVWVVYDSVLDDTIFHKVGTVATNIFLKTSNTHEVWMRIYNGCGMVETDSTFKPHDTTQPPAN